MWQQRHWTLSLGGGRGSFPEGLRQSSWHRSSIEGEAAAKFSLVLSGKESSRNSRFFHQANSVVRFWAFFLRISPKSGSPAFLAILRLLNMLWINSLFCLISQSHYLLIATRNPDKRFIPGRGYHEDLQTAFLHKSFSLEIVWVFRSHWGVGG